MLRWKNSLTFILVLFFFLLLFSSSRNAQNKDINAPSRFLVSYLCAFINDSSTILVLLTIRFPLSYSPVLPVYLTINVRTQLDWRPCCSLRTWWEWCTPCIVSCCTASYQSLLPRVRNLTALGSSRWLCKASASSTVLPCLTYLPSRYS